MVGIKARHPQQLPLRALVVRTTSEHGGSIGDFCGVVNGDFVEMFFILFVCREGDDGYGLKNGWYKKQGAPGTYRREPLPFGRPPNMAVVYL